MDCARSLELLSDFRDDALDREIYVQVQSHLSICVPCAGVFSELNIIVVAAHELREEPAMAFPDESLVWRRLGLAKHARP